jgi:hypothetical protein
MSKGMIFFKRDFIVYVLLKSNIMLRFSKKIKKLYTKPFFKLLHIQYFLFSVVLFKKRFSFLKNHKHIIHKV